MRRSRSGATLFLKFVAFISINIGFLNILPIPVLDGGHLVFILLEAVARRPIPVKIKLAIQQVGMIGLLIFMAFVLWNDAANHTGLLSKVMGLFGKS
ncbi:MAG: site-2 protease family protein [Candidatus Eisenbacteria bacterium]